ncbi:peptidylprolyl isomerase [Synechococcus sp. 1G10]|uniref:peptidylprolyl isomerase n=1 Tax=Synechococcus sp. 1G10 TaxID=2025605 RepID=UPI000B98A7DE|nr:peptidylprolyl isomerase [Synechococcus sp. 1G10]
MDSEPLYLTELRRHGLLQEFVKRQVVADAVKGIPLAHGMAEQLLGRYRESNGLSSEEAFSTHLVERGLDRTALQWQLELPVRLDHYTREHFADRAEQRFLGRKTELDQIVYSLIRVKDPFLARELYLQIAESEASFSDLATRHSQGQESQSQGLIGPVPLGVPHPSLAERLRTATVGEVLEPIQVAEWWLLIRLESMIPASFDPAMQARMTRELFEEWVQTEVTRRLVANSLQSTAV